MKSFFTLILFIFMNTFIIYAGDKARWVTAESGLTMREEADDNSTEIITVPYGEKVFFIEDTGKKISMDGVQGKWTRVFWNENVGWVFDGYLSMSDPKSGLDNITEDNLIGFWCSKDGAVIYNLGSDNLAEIVESEGDTGTWRLDNNTICIDIDCIKKYPDSEGLYRNKYSLRLEIAEFNAGYLKVNETGGYERELYRKTDNNNSYNDESNDNAEGTWEKSKEELKSFTGHTDYILSLDFSRDMKTFISGANDKTIKLWDLETGNEIRTFSGHTDFVCSAKISPDGKTILSGSGDETLKLWDLNTGKELRTFKGHTSSVYSVCYTPDGKRAVSCSYDQTMILWDIGTGKKIRTFTDKSGSVNSVDISPDGKFIISGADDKNLKLWDINTGKKIRTFTGHTDIIISVKFSPDGRSVVSCGKDNSIILWDVNSGKEIKTFTGHTNAVTSACFSPDGKYIFSGSWDYTVRLWDIASGKEIRQINCGTKEIISAGYSPDGKYGLSGGNDSTVKLWDIESMLSDWNKE